MTTQKKDEPVDVGNLNANVKERQLEQQAERKEKRQHSN